MLTTSFHARGPLLSTPPFELLDNRFILLAEQETPAAMCLVEPQLTQCERAQGPIDHTAQQ